VCGPCRREGEKEEMGSDSIYLRSMVESVDKCTTRGHRGSQVSCSPLLFQRVCKFRPAIRRQPLLTPTSAMFDPTREQMRECPGAPACVVSAPFLLY
jgi:hypothetical protein